MSASTPVLYVFAISHYCEKARWALDYLDIDYKLRHVAPGEHRQLAKKLGAPRSSVPYLGTGEQVIQGSGDIIDWADTVTPSKTKRLTPDADRESCRMIEQRLDEIAGVHIRRFYYSDALVNYPQTVRPVFTRDLSLKQKLLTGIFWRRICNFMIARMDLGSRQGQESRDIIEGELDWFDGLLADDGQYLVGERFSRADITAASLLAPLVLPAEHPTYSSMGHAPNMAAVLAGWDDRPSIDWVRNIYAQHR